MNEPIQIVNNQDRICRLCGKINIRMYNIYKDEGPLLSLDTYINYYLPISVTQIDRLPKNVCTKCANILQLWASFSSECIKVDQQLKELLQNCEKTTEDNFVKIETPNTGYESAKPNILDKPTNYVQPFLIKTEPEEPLVNSNEIFQQTVKVATAQKVIKKYELRNIPNRNKHTIGDTENQQKNVPLFDIPSTAKYTRPFKIKKGNLMPDCKYKCRLKISKKMQLTLFNRINYRNKNIKALAYLYCRCINIGKPDKHYIYYTHHGSRNEVEVCQLCFLWSVGKYNSIDLDIKNYLNKYVTSQIRTKPLSLRLWHRKYQKEMLNNGRRYANFIQFIDVVKSLKLSQMV